MVWFDRPVLSIGSGTFNQWHQVALHAFSRYVGAAQSLPPGNLVDLVEKHDAVLLDGLYCFLHELIGVEQLVGFFIDQDVMRFLNGYATRLCAAPAKFAEDIADIDCAHLRTRHARDLEHWHAATSGLHFDLYFLVVQLACSQLLAETLACGRARTGTDQCV